VVRGIMILLCICLTIDAPAAEPLPPGIHKGLTSEDGNFRFTVIVPTAGAAGQQLPAILVMPKANGLDPSPWQTLAERRGCYVVAFELGTISSSQIEERLPLALEHVTSALVQVQKRVNLHPFLRFVVADSLYVGLGPLFVAREQQAVAGLLITQPFFPFSPAELAGIPRHVPVFLLIGKHDTLGRDQFDRMRSQLRDAGLLLRSAEVESSKENYPVPQHGCDLAVEHLLDLALVTHPKWPIDQRKANIQAVLERGNALAALDGSACHAPLFWLLTIPGLEKQKKQVEALANRWTACVLAMAKARPEGELTEMHEDISILAKRAQFRLADKDHQKLVTDELKALRKDKRIKAEIAAADLFADILAMLDEDFSTAKQRIALKQMEDLVAKHPATHAGKEAAKLLEPLRRNLR
jgi:hypothetical protein